MKHSSQTYHSMIQDQVYRTTLPGASHWSFIVRKGMSLTLKDLNGSANVAMLMYNPNQLTEKYNAPDTLKCQHTFKLTTGNCLYSEMGRIFCSIIHDTFGWHETLCGTSHAQHIEQQFGERDYQQNHNLWMQNGFDSFLVELAKYNLKKQDMTANVNWFSEVSSDDDGKLTLSRQSQAGDNLTLRFEMDTLVVLNTCPHPLLKADSYPYTPVEITLAKAPAMASDDVCFNHCHENQRGFENNALYHLGL